MINYSNIELIRHYCDINDIPYHLSWDRVVEYMESNPTHNVFYYTPYAWLFCALHQLITNKIDLTIFMNYADILSPASLGFDGVDDNSVCIVYDNLVKSHIIQEQGKMYINIL